MKNYRSILAAYALFAAILVVLFGVAARPAAAHPMPDSLVMLDINRNDVGMSLHIPLVELEIAYGKQLSADPNGSIARYQDDLAAYFAKHIGALSPDRQPWHVTVKNIKRGADQTPPFWPKPTPYVDTQVTLMPPPGASVRHFTLNYDVVVHQLLTHVALVSVQRDWDNGVFSNNPLVLGELRVFNKSFLVDLPATTPWRGFLSVVQLGMRHIAEGTDHLLFLLVLLLPASLAVQEGKWQKTICVRQSIFRLLKIVTAFTIGHSLTLIAGALGWIHVPTQPIEVLIALSIFVSAIHAIRPIFPNREPLIAAGFGLIHGLAFASVISEFHLDTWHTILSIFGFNVGIEVMQLAVVGMTAPWLLLLARTPSTYKPVRVLVATVAGIAAIGWMAERSLGWANPIGALVDKAAAHAIWLVVGLAMVALGATLCQHWQPLRESILNRSYPISHPEAKN